VRIFTVQISHGWNVMSDNDTGDGPVSHLFFLAMFFRSVNNDLNFKIPRVPAYNPFTANATEPLLLDHPPCHTMPK